MLKINKMKNIIIPAILMITLSLFAQNNKGKTDDLGRIILSSYVPEQIEGMPAAAMSSLENKLSQIATSNGMGGSSFNSRFIITANVNVLSKDITPTAPPMHAYTLEITFYIGDGFDGIKFSSYSVNLKGVGKNETKAYIAALKNLKTNDSQYHSFIDKGKSRIIEYYNSRCDFILKEAQSLVSRNEFDAAIYTLTSVPEVCADCYGKSMDAVGPIYQKQIDRDCQLKLAEANAIWSANQDISAANYAGEVLSGIEPQSACYKSAFALTQKIASRVKELDKREWNFKLKQQQDNVNVKKSTIDAVKAIGVAYGNGQPKSVVYNTRGWW